MPNRRPDKYSMSMTATEEEAAIPNYEVLLCTYTDQEGYQWYIVESN